LLETVGSDAFGKAPIQTLNFVGKKPDGNEIERVCGVLLNGYPSAVDTGFSAGQITTFKFSLGAEVLELSSPALETYINGVLALNKEDIDLLSSITSGTLDLCSAGVDVGSLSAPGTLIDTIKQGEQMYIWSGSAWTAA
jgi:hypothetical protein